MIRTVAIYRPALTREGRHTAYNERRKGAQEWVSHPWRSRSCGRPSEYQYFRRGDELALRLWVCPTPRLMKSTKPSRWRRVLVGVLRKHLPRSDLNSSNVVRLSDYRRMSDESYGSYWLHFKATVSTRATQLVTASWQFVRHISKPITRLNFIPPYSTCILRSEIHCYY